MGDFRDQQEALGLWYQTPLGAIASHAVIEQIEPYITTMYGYHALQLGLPGCQSWIRTSPIPHDMLFTNYETPLAQICTYYSQLPLPNDSIDLVLLPHTLAFSENSGAILAEVDRILIPNGHIIIIGFNAFSLFGISKMLTFARKQPFQIDSQLLFLTRRHLTDLGYKITYADTFFFRPFLNNMEMLNSLQILETLGKLTWFFPGSYQVVIAQKMVSTLTPINPILSYKNLVLDKSSAPTAQVHNRRLPPK